MPGSGKGVPEVATNSLMSIYDLLVKPRQPGPGERLASGVTIEQVADALEGVGTARSAYHGVLAGLGRDIVVRGEGVTDFSANTASMNLVVKKRQVEALEIGGDTFYKVSPEEQKTGKLWRWVHHCPYGADDLWAQTVAAIRQRPWLAGDGAELIDDVPVYRYSLLVSPRGDKRVPAMALLYAHLLSHGFDRLTVHAWLAEDMTTRKIRLHYLPRFDQRQAHDRFLTVDYADFGIGVDLVVPRPDQITGKPRQGRTFRRIALPAPSK